MPTCQDCGTAISRRSRWCKRCCYQHVSASLKGRPKPAGHGAHVAAARRGKPMPKYWGPATYNWNGGGDSWRGYAWRAQRSAALKRDTFRCQRCGATERLQVHHRKDIDETEGVWDNDLSNLETLCAKCHLAHHRQRIFRASMRTAGAVDFTHCFALTGKDSRYTVSAFLEPS